MSLMEFTIEGEDGSVDAIGLPEGFTELFAQEGESPAMVVADITLLAAAQQIHGIVHHDHGEVDEEVEAIEQAVLDAFEDRFGQSFGEMTGHAH